MKLVSLLLMLLENTEIDTIQTQNHAYLISTRLVSMALYQSIMLIVTISTKSVDLIEHLEVNTRIAMVQFGGVKVAP